MRKIDLFILALVTLGTGLVNVLSLGFYWPKWIMSACVWRTKREIIRRKRRAHDKD